MSPLVSSPIAVEIVIPVYNEERVLAANVRKLQRYMKREFTFPFRLTIADNASSDSTLLRAQALAKLDEVNVLHLEQKGRGRALRTAWTQSSADVVAYIWTSTSRRSSRRCRACSCRCFKDAPTSRSARASRRARTSRAGSSAS